MLIDDLKQLDLEDLRHYYYEWLTKQNLSKNTITTSKTEAFYVIRYNPEFDFWGMMESSNFEYIAREILIETLSEHSRGNVDSNINSYLAHLRRFRRFAFSDMDITLVQKENRSKPKLKIEKKSVDIPKPTIIEVDYYLNRWKAMENYRLQEDALDKLFYELAPNNKDIRDVLIKTATLNDFYSTNIFSIYPVAKHILSLNIDERLAAGDVTLVDDIKVIKNGEKVTNFYSFATKYCSHHNPLDYPIYDSYVEKVLKYFRDVDKFAMFKNDDLKDFRKFKLCLEEFSIYYKLEMYTLKELDQYIWQLGKKYFPKNYKKK